MNTEAINPFRPMRVRQTIVSEAQLGCLPARLPKSLFVSASLYRLLLEDQFTPATLDVALKRILHRWQIEGYLFQAKRIWFWQGESQRLLSRMAEIRADQVVTLHLTDVRAPEFYDR